MKRTLTLSMALLFLTALFFTGCDLINSILGGDNTGDSGGAIDLTATPVEFMRNDQNAITALRATISNLGSNNAENVGYSVLISGDSTISLSSDTVVYKGVVPLVEPDIPLAVTIDYATLVSPYISENLSQEPAAARYYVGLVLDPEEKILEERETNNQSVSGESAWLIDGDLYNYAVSFKVGLPASLEYYKRADVINNPSPSVIPASTGTHFLYLSLAEGGSRPDVTPDSYGFIVIDENAFYQFSECGIVTTVDYDASSGTTTNEYHLGFNKSGSYSLYLMLDAKDENTIVIQGDPSGTESTKSLDPYCTLPSDALATYDTFTLTGDKTLPEPGQTGGMQLLPGDYYTITPIA